MQKLSRLGDMNHFEAETPAPEPRVCSICDGLVPAFFVPSTGKWVAQRCECERALKRQAEAQKERAASAKLMAQHTYGGWLGDAWKNESLIKQLSSYTFEGYDPDRENEYQKLLQALAYIEKMPAKTIEETEKRTTTRMAYAGMIEAFEKGRKSWKMAKEKTEAFAVNPVGVLLLYGGYGLGKSHLLAAICNALRNRPVPMRSLFTSTPTFFSSFYDRMTHTNDEWKLVQQASRTPFFVFDDLDKSGPKPFRQEIFFQIIDWRVTAGLPIGISTNKRDALMDYIGEAAFSRLMVGCIPVEFASKDYRGNFTV